MDTLLAHAGVNANKKSYQNTALSPPLEFATTFTRPAEGPYEEGDAIYSRLDNPTRLLLEETIFHQQDGRGINRIDTTGKNTLMISFHAKKSRVEWRTIWKVLDY